MMYVCMRQRGHVAHAVDGQGQGTHRHPIHAHTPFALSVCLASMLRKGFPFLKPQYERDFFFYGQLAWPLCWVRSLPVAQHRNAGSCPRRKQWLSSSLGNLAVEHTPSPLLLSCNLQSGVFICMHVKHSYHGGGLIFLLPYKFPILFWSCRGVHTARQSGGFSTMENS